MNRFFQKFWLQGISLIVLSGLIILFWGNWLDARRLVASQHRASELTIAQESPPRTLTVTGEGNQSIPTTLTQVRLGVEVEGATATEVQEDAARRSTAVVDLLQSRDVAKLETTGIRLQPRYNYVEGERRLRGYQGINLVSFRLPTADMGNLLDEAVKAGATRIDSVSFTATESAIAQAQKQALQAATLDAEAQAEAVLGALNLRSQSVVNIQINNANPPVAPRMQALQSRGEAAESAASSPVIGGEQEVQARVTLQIAY